MCFFFKQANKPTVPITNEVKSKFVELCVNFCAKDIRPFTVVSEEGFKDVAQELIRIGSVYGNVPVNDVLPNPTTVSRNICKTADQVRNKISANILPFVQSGRCAATTDMWTDLKQTAYLSLTLHYVNDSWELTRNLFFTSPFPKERHTGDNIRMELRRRLQQFGLPEGAFDALMFVSDRGSNMLSALKSNVHFHCFAHVINTVLQKTFQEDYLKSNLPAILSLIEECKQLVRYMKKTGLVSQLKRTLHQQAETRWNTHFDMIISIQSQLQEIGQLLEEKK